MTYMLNYDLVTLTPALKVTVITWHDVIRSTTTHSPVAAVITKL